MGDFTGTDVNILHTHGLHDLTCAANNVRGAENTNTFDCEIKARGLTALILNEATGNLHCVELTLESSIAIGILTHSLGVELLGILQPGLKVLLNTRGVAVATVLIRTLRHRNEPRIFTAGSLRCTRRQMNLLTRGSTDLLGAQGSNQTSVAGWTDGTEESLRWNGNGLLGIRAVFGYVKVAGHNIKKGGARIRYI